MSKTIIFFGTDEFSLVALQGLIKQDYDIVAVVTKPDSKSGRGQSLTASCVKKLAMENGIEVWQPTKVSDINERIVSLESSVAGVLVSFGKIIPKSTIDLFDPAIINVHPSLLPVYRGPSPIESAIYNGDQQTGVSIMQLTPEMDAGPIYGQIYHQLSGRETRMELRETLGHKGTEALLSLLPRILDGTLRPTEQDGTKATYCNLLSKDDAQLIPQKLSASAAERAIRAHLVFPKTKTSVSGRDIIITKAHVSNEQKTPLDIVCLDDTFLSIDELVAPTGRTMSARDFLNGYN